MKLIDVDKLLSKLNETYDKVNTKYHETDFDSFYGGGCSMIQEIIKEIEEQPSVLGAGMPIDNFVNPFEVKAGDKNEQIR